MKPYSETSGRSPDFRVRYEWLPQTEDEHYQRPFQHMRSDFLYEVDDPTKRDEGAWCIHPEFEAEDGSILDLDADVPQQGTATMWIVFQGIRGFHRERLSIGSRGFLVFGSAKLAKVEVIELLALAD